MSKGTPEIMVLKQKFTEYYKENTSVIKAPPLTNKREFGFVLFDEKMMVRHKSFEDIDSLLKFVIAAAPSDIYYSAAYYKNPTEGMDKKGWLGADLVFDIDADHLSTPCKTEHDLWICELCGNGEYGYAPKICPYCGGEKLKEITWLCDTCLEAAKAETTKLIEFLIGDLGFVADNIGIYFSGHRGYHVHVTHEAVRTLNQLARKEITDYIRGTGLQIEYQGLKEVRWGGVPEVIGPDLYDSGWRGRIARGVYDIVVNARKDELEKIEGLKKNTVERLIASRETFLRAWKEKNPWKTLKGIGLKTWEKIVKYAVDKQSVKIDTVVTTDVHRLMRMPDTLHGKTGLKTTKISMEHLETFDPLTESIVFKNGTLTLFVSNAYKFRLGNKIYGPYKNEKIELPTAAAIFLLCKGVAKLQRGQQR